jgi:PQQ-like domain
MNFRGTILVPAALVALAACDRQAATYAAKLQQKSLSLGTRSFAAGEWRVAWQREAGGADSLLVQPFRFAADDERLYVLDGATGKVVALRAEDGEPTWSYGGGGEGGFAFATALNALPGGGVAVWDSERSVLGLLGADGRLAREIPVPGLGVVSSLCALEDGGFLLSPLGPEHAPVVRVSAEGRVVNGYSLPWKGFREVPSLARQLLIAGQADRCVAALTMGRGFSRFDGGFRRAGEYVETFELPQVQKLADGEMQRLIDPLVATSAAVVAGDTLVVAFEGTTDQAGRILDYYEARSGRYLHSRAVPHRIGQMSRSGSTYFVLDDQMRLLALQPTPAARAAVKDRVASARHAPSPGD